MQTVIIVIHLIVVVAMVGVVLLQRSEGGGLGIGGGGGFLTNRGSANVLTRTTAILAGVFFLSSLVLSVLAGLERKPASILQSTGAPASQPGPAAPAPTGGGSGGGLLDALRQGGGGEGPAGGTPGGPQVPRSQ
jgi:preprotein translocase subunit SecG